MTAMKEASNTGKDIHADLQALQEDVAKLTKQFADIFSEKGNAAWRRAKANVGEVVSDAQERGSDAIDSIRDVSDGLMDAVDDSMRQRPYTTLALAIGLGFLVGATWRK
jgi:ElaB/YqjD/DUF883 family membrane-anchored ribosome-binding protein